MEDFLERLSRRYGESVGTEVIGNLDIDRWAPFHEGAWRERERYWATHTQALLASGSGALAQAYRLFADEASRALYVELLLYRLLGQKHVRLPRNDDEHWRHREQAQAQQGAESAFTGTFGRLRRFNFTFNGQPIAVDCTWFNVAWTFLMGQYYFQRDGVIIRPEAGDTAIDAGACFVDTALAFAASTGEHGRVHAFEIDPENLVVARHNLALNPWTAGRIELHEAALGDAPATRFLHGSGPGAMVSEAPSGRPIKVTTLDDFVRERDLARLDFVKMDIEGSELGALAGAREALVRFRPKLAISLYHRADDLFRIPMWLAGLDVGYVFYLEHYTIHHEETVLYATAM